MQLIRMRFITVTLAFFVSLAAQSARAAEAMLRVGVFRVDVTPTLGSPVAYAPARKIEDPLSARGIVLLGAGQPVVLCAPFADTVTLSGAAPKPQV